MGRQQSLNLNNERIGIAGLDDDRVEARLHGSVLQDDMRVAGRGNQRNVPRCGLGSELASDVEPREVRQIEIQDDQIGIAGNRRGERLPTGACGQHPEAFGAEIHFPDIQGIGVVVNDENGSRASHG